MKAFRGQSMVEFAVAMTVMSLLLLGTVTLAQYQQVERHTLLAAREMSFAGGWAGMQAGAGTSATRLHEVLFTQAGVREPLRGDVLVADEDLRVENATARLQGLAAQSAEAMVVPLRVAGGWLGRGFDLTTATYSRGSVRARIAPLSQLPAPFDGLDLSLEQPFAIVGDAWHAGGSGQVTGRAGALVPTTALAGIRQLWQPLSAALSVVEPSIAEWCPGLIEADRIPEDRLGVGTTPLPRGCP